MLHWIQTWFARSTCRCRDPIANHISNLDVGADLIDKVCFTGVRGVLLNGARDTRSIYLTPYDT